MEVLAAKLADLIWGPWTIGLLVALGLLTTFAARAIQFRRFGHALHLLKQRALRRDLSSAEPGDITPFQALTTAMAATIGNGNIAGVATAIAIGGPGAAFWMAAIAPLGLSLIHI